MCSPAYTWGALCARVSPVREKKKRDTDGGVESSSPYSSIASLAPSYHSHRGIISDETSHNNSRRLYKRFTPRGTLAAGSAAVPAAREIVRSHGSKFCQNEKRVPSRSTLCGCRHVRNTHARSISAGEQAGFPAKPGREAYSRPGQRHGKQTCRSIRRTSRIPRPSLAIAESREPVGGAVAQRKRENAESDRGVYARRIRILRVSRCLVKSTRKSLY